MKKSVVVIVLSIAMLFGSCEGGDKDEVVIINTPFGEMVVVLYDQTPKHKENFLKLAKEHYYDSLLFHRVIQGFMIQGGDPDSKHAAPGQNLGMGGPDYTVPAEFNPELYHEKGALAAARTGDQQNPEKASSGSQFYIVQGTKVNELELLLDRQKFTQAMTQMKNSGQFEPFFDSLNILTQVNDAEGYYAMVRKSIPRVEKASGMKVTSDASPEKIKAYSTLGGVPFLDGSYTVFGKVIKGLDVIDKIATVPKDGYDRPNDNVWMTMKVEKMSKKKIEKEYGYKYPVAKKG